MEWIARHGSAISALTGLGTLMVWVVYLQVFVSSYRRQLRATLLITRGPGHGLEARCFLSNMSSGPVYVTSVQVQLDATTGTTVSPVTDILDVEVEGTRKGARPDHLPAPARPGADLGAHTRQGPLFNGETRDIGSFQELIRQAAVENLSATRLLRSVTIEVVGLYGSEDLPVGARRCFVVLDRGGELIVRGQEIRTQQIRRRRDRRDLLSHLERDP